MKSLEEGEEAEDVAISVMAMDASLYEVPSDVASDVIFIEMSKLPRYFDEAYSVSGARRFNITIPTSHQVSMPTQYCLILKRIAVMTTGLRGPTAARCGDV